MKIDITEIPVYYINLDGQEERKRSLEILLKEAGFKNIERFPGVLSDKKRIGCSTSHRNLLEKIIKDDVYPALVLEDDVSFFEFRETIECPDDADAMYLGFSRYGFSHNQDDPNFRSLKIREFDHTYHRVQNMLARHAVIHFNAEYDQACVDVMNKFIDDPKTYVAGDASLAKINPEYKVYCLNTPVFYQNDKYTRGLTKHSIYSCDYINLDEE